MADRSKKPEHDDAWWAAQRHAYIEKNDILLSDHPSWEWVSPYDFWRTIFPEGFLQPRGEEVPWHERGGGHPNGIAIQITNRTKTVKTKTGRRRDVPVVERFTLTDDLDGVMERVIDSNRKNESVFCAPVSFFGKSRVAENARFLHAFAIDLDGVGVQELKNMLKQFRNGRDPKFAADKWVSLPQPTFLVNSGTGFHLYYVLDQPIPLIPRIVPFVQEIKAMLTDYIWRDTVSTLEDVQHQGIYQPFRMPGTPTKLNGKAAGSKIKDKYEAVAFVHNGEDGKPWRCSLDYLLGYAGVRGGKDRAELIELMRTAGRTPIERAKKLWPKLQQGRRQERGALKAPLSVSSPAALRYGHETIGEDSAGIRTRRLALGLSFLLKCPLHGSWNLERQRHGIGRGLRKLALDDFADVDPSARPLIALKSALPVGNHLVGNDLAVLGNDSVHVYLHPSSRLNFFVGGAIAWNTHQTPSISMNPISSANLPSGREPTEIQSGGSSVPFRWRHLIGFSHAYATSSLVSPCLRAFPCTLTTAVLLSSLVSIPD